MKVFNICDYGAVFSDQLQTKAIQNAIDDCFLAGGGRVLIRPSGTEPLVRVMLEGSDPEQIKTLAEDLARLIEKKFK